MKHTFTLLLSFTLVLAGYSQTTYDEVYTIFQTNCATANCHNATDFAGNLDLEGTGATLADKKLAAYDNVYKVTPDNSYAAAKKNFNIYPGDPYRSFLFRKISAGFSDDNPLDANEGEHNAAAASLSDYEKEVIRQWIVYGAKSGADEVDLSLVSDFYTNGGIESIASAIAPPAESEGFQIHLGPFYIPPGAEVEYLSKYETLLDQTTEIIKFQTEMGNFSHHYIVYNYADPIGGGTFDPSSVEYGLREDIGFDGKSFVLTEQYSNTLETPEGTAFKWDANTVLDLNSHYINYSTTQILKCEVYLNVYTQDNGTAAQEMITQLVPETNIPIPNNGQEVTFESQLNIPSNLNLYIWGAVAHTHQYGTDFNIYRRNVDGSRGPQVYDAGCANGMPGCAVEDYDYKHLPFRFYEPFMQVNLQEGLIAEASYLNDGPVPVDWGLTSDDEMMLFIIFFTLDTAGIAMYEDSINTGIRQNITNNADVNFYPNPVGSLAKVDIKGINNGESTFNIIDLSGKVCLTQSFDHQDQSSLQINAEKFNNGMYFYEIQQGAITVSNGKFVVNK